MKKLLILLLFGVILQVVFGTSIIPVDLVATISDIISWFINTIRRITTQFIFFKMAKYKVNCIGCWQSPLVECTNCRRSNFTKQFKHDRVILICKRCGEDFFSYTHECSRNSIFSEHTTRNDFSKKNLSKTPSLFSYIVIFFIVLYIYAK